VFVNAFLIPWESYTGRFTTLSEKKCMCRSTACSTTTAINAVLQRDICYSEIEELIQWEQKTRTEPCERDRQVAVRNPDLQLSAIKIPVSGWVSNFIFLFHFPCSAS
jgi:hypothetical protein